MSVCTCCNGRRVVPDINGQPRPCSRCRAEDFSKWSAGRALTVDEQRIMQDALRRSTKIVAKGKPVE
jgi:hypothetical protein